MGCNSKRTFWTFDCVSTIFLANGKALLLLLKEKRNSVPLSDVRMHFMTQTAHRHIFISSIFRRTPSKGVDGVMQLSMLYPRGGGGGGAPDRVGTLNVLAHPTWGILANFEHKC